MYFKHVFFGNLTRGDIAHPMAG